MPVLRFRPPPPAYPPAFVLGSRDRVVALLEDADEAARVGDRARVDLLVDAAREEAALRVAA